MFKGDPKFARQMLSMLAEDLKSTKIKLEKAQSTNDANFLGSELHRVRGIVCYFKLPRLEEALKIFHQGLSMQLKLQIMILIGL